MAGEIIAPSTPGDAQGPAPLRFFGSGGAQTEQIYDASFFPGPTEITAVSFRAYPGSAPNPFFTNSVSVSDLIVTLSNTQVSADEMSGLQPSTTFADNIGANAQTVFSGAIALTTAATGTGAQPFDYTVNFSTPFLYDPSQGNLLLDVLIPGTATVSGAGFGFQTFDTTNDLNNGVQSVVDINDGSSPTGFLSPAAAITEFTTADVPTAVPEPATWALMLVGLGGLGAMARRSRVRPAIA